MEAPKRRARPLLVATVVVASAFLPGTSEAGRYESSYPPDGENPLRITSYFVKPVGMLLEWAVARPLAALDEAIWPESDPGVGGFAGCSRERPARSCTDIVK